MKRVFNVIAMLALSMGGAHAQAPNACDTSRGISEGGNADLITAVRRSLSVATIGPSNCNSFIAVLRQLTSSRPRAGSQLKGGSGPDPAAAATEIADMRKDPAQASALDAIQKEPSAFTRAMLEAAHFHANGMYSARDVRLEEARKLVEGK
jgi:hypothetical protein